jgi:hypothetical protein
VVHRPVGFSAVSESAWVASTRREYYELIIGAHQFAAKWESDKNGVRDLWATTNIADYAADKNFVRIHDGQLEYSSSRDGNNWIKRSEILREARNALKDTKKNPSRAEIL